MTGKYLIVRIVRAESVGERSYGYTLDGRTFLFNYRELYKLGRRP